MRLSQILIFALVLLIPQTSMARRNPFAERAWKPFFAAFRAAVKKRDREAVKKMMVRDFFFSGGGGDDNGDSDTRDEAFQFWDEVRGWKAFDRVLSKGTVPMAAWWDSGRKRKYISRVAPPAANIRRNINRGGILWYAVFEFREGQWYCTIFNQCCD